MQIDTFDGLGLSPKVLTAINAVGYTKPTPIQAQAIPVAIAGRDVLGIAQTGTGKTAGFVLPMLTRLETGRARARMPRSLILAPTRELAAQVAQSFETYGTNHKLTVALLIGGVSMDDQVKKLDRGVDVLIATPGRLLDHFQRGRIMLMGVEILVIDEADRMLDMGFIPDIEKICKLLPTTRQTLFFSATMPPEITRLVANFLKDPVRIEVTRPATAATTITQRFKFCASGEDWAKREALRNLIDSAENIKNAIIFCNRKRDVAILLKSMIKHGYNCGALHGDMDQMSRMATLAAFREGKITYLAASDVAARGLDIPDVSHVFNFDVPWQADDYVHRIGRTGRAGREGQSATLVTPDDMKSLMAIEKMLGGPATWIDGAPDAETIAEGGRRRGRRGPTRSGGPMSGRGERRPSGRDGARDGRRDRGRETTRAPAGDTGQADLRADEARPAQRGRSVRDEGRRGRRQRDERPARETEVVAVGVTERSEPERGEYAPARRSEHAPAGRGERAPHARRERGPGRAPAVGAEEAGREGLLPHAEGLQRFLSRSVVPPREARPAARPAVSEGEIPRAEPEPRPRVDAATAPKGGLGDNIPAFLRRPPRTAPRP